MTLKLLAGLVLVLAQAGQVRNPPSFNSPSSIETDVPLVAAAHNGDLEKVKTLLDSGVSVNTRDKVGRTPLYAALSNGFTNVGSAGYVGLPMDKYEAMARYLVGRGADVRARAPDGTTPLSMAVANGPTSVVSLLLAHGADVNAADHKGWTPLMRAMSARGRYMVRALGRRADQFKGARTDRIPKLLLDAGARTDALADGGMTPLACAARVGDVDTMRLLLGRGANLQKQGEVALREAAMGNNVAAIALLLDRGLSARDHGGPALFYSVTQHRRAARDLLLARGADPNKAADRGDYALSDAVLVSSLDDVQALLNHGARPDLADRYESPPLWIALQIHSQKRAKTVPLEKNAIVMRLLTAGADVNAKDRRGQVLLCNYAMMGDNEVVGFLLAHGANLEEAGANGMTPLMWAASEGRAETIEMLIGNGSKVNAQNPAGYTALHCAALGLRVDTARVLLRHGAKPNIATRNHGTPLLSVICRGNDSPSGADELALVDMLLAAGANVNVQGLDGWGLVHACAETGNMTRMRFLLVHGADVNLRTKFGGTALSIASQKHNEAMIRFLKKAGAKE